MQELKKLIEDINIKDISDKDLLYTELIITECRVIGQLSCNLNDKILKDKEAKKYYCWNCNTVEILEPVTCCSGSDCCCMGLPIEPPFCSDKCCDEYFSKKVTGALSLIGDSEGKKDGN